MDITATMVKTLRERTGAGMMDCKTALVEAEGDQDKAVEVLRKKGADMASAKAARTASQGAIVCAVSEDRRVGALVEVNCETDFVARGDEFQGFSVPLAVLALETGGDSDDIAALHGMRMADGATVEEARHALIAKIGENIAVRNMRVYKAGDGCQVAAYVHLGKIGVMVELEGGEGELGYDVAMHVAAMRPQWIDGDDVSESALETERRIYAEQASGSGKPEAIIGKIVEGRVRKFVAENTLYGQAFVKDQDVSVGKLLQSRNASVKRFVRIVLGEDAA